MLTKIVNGVEVQMSADEEAKIKAEWEKNQIAYNKTIYAENRKSEYPSIAEQLDIIFHKGIDDWKALIQSIKDKYPKPTE